MNIKKRQEVINLMPWYNLGKLSADEKSMVETALLEDPSLNDQLKLDQDVMARIIADPKLLDKSAFAPSTVRLDKVLAQIDASVVKEIASKAKSATKKETKSVSMFAGVKSFFESLLSGSSHSFTYAVFAALTVVQLALLMFFVVPATSIQINDDGYNSANGEKSEIFDAKSLESIMIKNASGLVLNVTIKDNVKTDDIIKVLKNDWWSQKIESFKIEGDKKAQ